MSYQISVCLSCGTYSQTENPSYNAHYRSLPSAAPSSPLASCLLNRWIPRCPLFQGICLLISYSDTESLSADFCVSCCFRCQYFVSFVTRLSARSPFGHRALSLWRSSSRASTFRCVQRCLRFGDLRRMYRAKTGHFRTMIGSAGPRLS